ncbi:MAG: ABC transporter ATP-binding protein [Desulfobacteraceae bacterium]|nr:ABC transporter ATP-binding protein [Desulfobacteraceae bacterium]
MINIDAVKCFKSYEIRFDFKSDSNRIVLFGPSGSGKTTILKMIAGFFHPDGGNIRINGETLYSSNENIIVPAHKRNIGYLPQEYTLFPNMSVRANILYGVKAKKLDMDEQYFQMIINKIDIAHCLDRMPDTLSGGQQQRVALARILLIKPRMLLLDEPFSALDQPIRESLRDLVIDISDETGIPTIFVTHDIKDAYIFGKDIVVIDNGIVIECGKKQNIYNSPQYVETARLFDFKNIWKLSDANFITPLKAEISGPCDCIGIRPENVLILGDDIPREGSFGENMLKCRIDDIRSRGRYVKLGVSAKGNNSIIIHIPEHDFTKMNISKGKEINISLKQESLIYFKKRR